MANFIKVDYPEKWINIENIVKIEMRGTRRSCITAKELDEDGKEIYKTYCSVHTEDCELLLTKLGINSKNRLLYFTK
jgi:hypothetical protein